MNGQVPLGYEEVEKKKKEVLTMPRIPSPPGYEEVPKKEPEPVMREKVFDPEGAGYDYESAERDGITPKDGHWPSRVGETGLILKGMSHETIDKTLKAERERGYRIYKKGGRYYSVFESADWRKELPGAIKETLGELPVVKGWSKFITKQVPSGEFWKRAGETARSQLQQFIREKVLDPEDIYKSVMGEKKPKKKVSLKEIGKQGLNFITFLPVTFDKFVQNPGEVIGKEPLNFLMLATVLGKGGAKAIKTKAARGKPVTGKDVHRVVDEMPEKLLTKEQKLGIKSKIPEQIELPLGKAGPTGKVGPFGSFESELVNVHYGTKTLVMGDLVLTRPAARNYPRLQHEVIRGKFGDMGVLYLKENIKKARSRIQGLRKIYEDKTTPRLTPKEHAEIGRLLDYSEADIRAFLSKLEPAAGITPAQKIMTALKEAKPLRKEQEALYTAERAKRFPRALEALEKVRGRKGFEAARIELKGKMEKVEFEALKLTQVDVEALFNQIIDSPAVVGIEKMPTGIGLAKLLGEKGGVVPTAGELKLLSRVFGEEFVKTIMSKRGRWDKIKGGMLEGANVPRALMASYDLSFGLRQGIFLAARYPKEFIRAFGSQFKLFGSDKAFKALKEEIASRPTYKLMKRPGERHLQLTEMDAGLALREEAMMGAAWAEKIPVVGLGVRASNRAYTGMANKLRADVFDHLIKSAEKAGRNPWKDNRLVDSIVDFVNAGSGRGTLRTFEKAAVNLNTVLFSPRLIASRFNLLNPKFYIKLDPFVRKQALQSLFAFAGMTTTVLALAKLSGAEVGLDPRSADFAKIKIGNTRLDIMGGFQQYIRTAAQLASKRIVSTTTGKVTKLGEGYKPQTRATISLRALEYKLAPVASFAVNLYRGRTTFGEPIDVPEEVAKRFVPMVIQDVIDLAREDPELLPLVTPGFFGVGIQTYGAKKKEGVVY